MTLKGRGRDALGAECWVTRLSSYASNCSPIWPPAHPSQLSTLEIHSHAFPWFLLLHISCLFLQCVDCFFPDQGLHFSPLGGLGYDTLSARGSREELAKQQPQVKSLQGLQEGEALSSGKLEKGWATLRWADFGDLGILDSEPCPPRQLHLSRLGPTLPDYDIRELLRPHSVYFVALPPWQVLSIISSTIRFTAAGDKGLLSVSLESL